MPKANAYGEDASRKGKVRKRKSNDVDDVLHSSISSTPDDDLIENNRVPSDPMDTKQLSISPHDWPPAHLTKLLTRMAALIPLNDTLRYKSRVKKLAWEDVAFDDYTIEECYAAWRHLKRRCAARSAHLLRDVIHHAKLTIAKKNVGKKQQNPQPARTEVDAQKAAAHTTLPRTPKRPPTAFAHYFEDRVDKEAALNFNRTAFKAVCKERWRHLPRAEKMSWINCALEEEAQYREAMALRAQQDPTTSIRIKTVLTKEEQQLIDDVAGKPRKPPTSTYGLYAQELLMDEAMKSIAPKQRMQYIAMEWKRCTAKEKQLLEDRLRRLNDEYKVDYGVYLEKLSAHKRAKGTAKRRR